MTDTLQPVASRPINDRAKPNDTLFDASFTRMGIPHLVHIYAPTREAARSRVAAHYQLDLPEEANVKVTRPDV